MHADVASFSRKLLISIINGSGHNKTKTFSRTLHSYHKVPLWKLSLELSKRIVVLYCPDGWWNYSALHTELNWFPSSCFAAMQDTYAQVLYSNKVAACLITPSDTATVYPRDRETHSRKRVLGKHTAGNVQWESWHRKVSKWQPKKEINFVAAVVSTILSKVSNVPKTQNQFGGQEWAVASFIMSLLYLYN
jgi:hypothetical protein